MNGTGWFWRPGDEKRVPGEFVAEAGQDAQAILHGRVIADPGAKVTHDPVTGETTITDVWDPAAWVAASAPIVLHGQLEPAEGSSLSDGELVTLLGAQKHRERSSLFGPLDVTLTYVARSVVIGAHVSEDQLYSAVRFRLDDAFWTAHLADEQASIVPDDGSILRAERSDHGTWLTYEAAQPHSLGELDRRVLSGFLALARLVFDRPLSIRAVEVRLPGVHKEEDGGWHPLHSKAMSMPTTADYHDPLLPRDELTVGRLATWIALNDRLDGLASAAGEPVYGPVQVQVLVTTSLVEGLHRRFGDVYEQSQFPEASRTTVDKLKKAARRAAADRAETLARVEPELAHAAVKDAVSHIEDVGYRTRAQDILNEVTRAVPEVTQSIPDLADELMTARNDITHHIVIDEKKEPLSHRIDRLIVVSYATPWLLRLFLLLHAGVDADVLRAACLQSQRFGLCFANVAAIARELGWASPPG